MDNLNKRPSKGILRFSEGSSRSNSVEKDIKWDETNIKETLHPTDKDYGFMPIDEPPTPYSRSPGYVSGENSEDDEDLHNRTSDLLNKVSKKIKEPPVTIENVEGLLDEEVLQEIEKESDTDFMNGSGSSALAMEQACTSSSSSVMTPTSSRMHFEDESDISSTSGTGCGSAGKNDFELKRKRHYNEFHAVKLAKKLMEREQDDEEDEETRGNDEDKTRDREAAGRQEADTNKNNNQQ